MKYIKKFEYNGFTAYKTGDYIKCVDDYDTSNYLVAGEIYIADGIDDRASHGVNQVKIDEDWWRTSRFVLATPEEIENWKIKKSVEIYNL